MSTIRRQPGRQLSLYQQVAQAVRDDIKSGALRDGEALPSTREMAEARNVSVFTITEAMKMLCDEGLIVAKSRSRRVVRVPESRPQALPGGPGTAAERDPFSLVLEEPDPVIQARRAGDLIALYQERIVQLAVLQHDAINRASQGDDRREGERERDSR